ncbi:flavin monoamine oxidase family protein [Capillimicrobium parvum]|uniref:Pseudooxynicotine oxidase n=1 Tax=Capillimicrobium parvum TaxID=2884022 RepID=A0A9E6XWZ2_9ACTN|nr:NAD(P)/FAD-dependent oxidoreductase [Capillimicrobium parvum]UGS36009.1 Pseudooxynicotine oxidase [Capillimicrobium parvum]
MQRPDPDPFDVIVVGGGFSGLRAARDLRDAGQRVLLLEGRDRLGGRTFLRPFAGHGQEVELGGTWVAPRFQPHVAAEMDRYGIGLVEGQTGVPRWRWGFDAAPTSAFPLEGDEIYELERAVFRIMEASHRVDPSVPRDRQDLGDLDVSVERFLAGLRLSPRTTRFLAAWGTLGSGAPPEEWSILNALSLMAAFDHSAWAWWAGVVDKFAGGTRTVVEALARDAAPVLELGARVVRVDQREPGRVVATTADGRTFGAAAAIVALPVNVWRDIEFLPALGPAKATLARDGHPNRMSKVWVLVDGGPTDTICFGPGQDLLWLSPEYELDGATLMVGFSAPPSPLDVTDPDAVARAVGAYLPNARVLASDAHDWNADPLARGGWPAHRPGTLSRDASALQEPEGRVCFGGADIATRWIGWLDGALESGARAAQQALAVLRDA